MKSEHKTSVVQKLLVSALLWAIAIATAYGQTGPASVVGAGKVSVALKQLLPPGAVQVAAMDSIIMNPRLVTLLGKFQQGIKANPQYLLDMQNKVATHGPGPMPYDKRVGMSEPEFKEFQALMDKREIKVAPSYIGVLNVKHEDEIIRFVGTGRLSMLNEVWIDLPKNEVHFLEYTLPFKTEVAVDDAHNAYGSAWTAYEWELHEPAGEIFKNIMIEKLKTMRLLQLQFQVGKLANTGKTLIKLKAQDISKGVKKYSVDTPFLVQ